LPFDLVGPGGALRLVLQKGKASYSKTKRPLAKGTSARYNNMIMNLTTRSSKHCDDCRQACASV